MHQRPHLESAADDEHPCPDRSRSRRHLHGRPQVGSNAGPGPGEGDGTPIVPVPHSGTGTADRSGVNPGPPARPSVQPGVSDHQFPTTPSAPAPLQQREPAVVPNPRTSTPSAQTGGRSPIPESAAVGTPKAPVEPTAPLAAWIIAAAAAIAGAAFPRSPVAITCVTDAG